MWVVRSDNIANLLLSHFSELPHDDLLGLWKEIGLVLACIKTIHPRRKNICKTDIKVSLTN